MHFGDIPEGMQVLHKCDNGYCVNPDHLFLGTQVDNIHDMDEKGRRISLRGEKHGRATISEQDAIKILALYRHGISFSKLAKTFKTTIPAVKCLAYRKTWKHLTETTSDA